jgi:hypothetical protein
VWYVVIRLRCERKRSEPNAIPTFGVNDPFMKKRNLGGLSGVGSPSEWPTLIDDQDVALRRHLHLPTSIGCFSSGLANPIFKRKMVSYQ